MSSSSPDFESEFRISPRLVSAILVILAVVGLLVSEGLFDPHQFRMRSLALLLYALSAIAWLLHDWKPRLGRWFIVIALVITRELAHSWQETPGTLALMAIPTGLAAALIGFPAAIATALGETALLLTTPKAILAGTYGAETVVALMSIWVALGLMYAVYRPAHQYALWSWKYYEQAQMLLEEARDRKVELAQALDDFAHANRQIALTNERLAAMRMIAEEAQKAKTAFVAKVSHEFRTPLNMIIGLTDLLIETPEVYGEQLPPALLEDLKIVYRNCEHLSSMINDVLDLSQAEAGRLTLHREWVDLAEIIDGAVVVVRPLLEKKTLGLQVHTSSDLPDIYCDRTRIRQVILNLVSNAARFTREGSITIRVTEKDQYVVIDVADTGSGISPEDAERIFEPFCQGTSNPWRERSGSGLGLSISKQFVELHGGRIWLTSELGVGTTFSFDLPISKPIEPVARPERWIKEEWIWVERTSKVRLPDSHYRPRIVICDETGSLYPALASYSDEAEFVDTRDLAQVAQDLRQCPAHAIILNTASPEDLWPLVEQARSETPDIPIVGCSVPPQVERALKAGAIGYLIKPVTRADLEETIHGAGKPMKRVLIVDDSLDVLRLLTRMLYACDGTVEVETALSGMQALDKLRSRRPDLLLLDIVMPDMDGWQVLELKNQDEEIRDIPVVFLSAQDPAEQPMESKALLTTMGEGLSLGKILRCSLAFSALMLRPD